MKYLAVFVVFLFATVSAAQNSMPSIESLDTGWNSIATDGVCSAGSPHQFYVKPAVQGDDLLVFFNGGGGCWFGQACDLSAQPNIHSPFADMDQNTPALAGGVFDFENSENPFADYNVVFLPYCTGDVHIGGGERNYTYQNAGGEEVNYTAYHNGYENSSAVLSWVYDNFESPDKIVLAGSSAGAIGSSFYSGIVAGHYGDTPVVLVADAAGGYGSPLMSITHEAWNSTANLPGWPEYLNETNSTISFEEFYIASANNNSNLTIAQYNAAEDETQKMFTQLIGDAPGSFSLPQRVFNNYQEIESGVDEFYTYTAGGPLHMILVLQEFYQYEVEGVRFVDWVSDLVNGNAVRDVSCVNEVNGCLQAPN